METSGAPRTRTTRSPWPAVVAAEILVLVGIALFFLGVARAFQDCTAWLGCDQGTSGGGGGFLVFLAVVSLVAAPAAVSYLSGHPSPGRAAALSVVAFLGAFALAAPVLSNMLAGLAVALGVGGSLALRLPSPAAVRARALLVLLLVVLCAASAQDISVSFVLAVLALPAIPVADAIPRALQP
jgi:hypothetical protein